jgi:hypothetical protein
VAILPRRRKPPSIDRPAMTARLADEGWVLPWGLARQVAAASAASAASAPSGARAGGDGLVNMTGRRWTPVGPAGGPVAVVDPAGLVTPRAGGWSIDWWVGADDRWRLPSREPAVRQGLVGPAPVVETAMRVPGGDAVHRCYGVPGALVVEVENRSPSPFALALAVRPYDLLGAAPLTTVAVEGERVQVDGRTALVLDRRPGRAAVATRAQGDVAALVLGGEASAVPPGDGPLSATCPDGMASVAVLVPVAHRTTVRAVIPLGEGGDGAVDALPSVDAVVRGWQAQLRTGLRAELPDPRLQRAFDAARCSLLLVDPDAAGPAEDAAVVVTALARLGRHAEADELVRALWSRQRTDGSFDEPDGRGAAGGAHLWALGEHLRLRADAGLARTLDRSMVAAEGWIRELEATGRLAATAARWARLGRHAAGMAAGEAGLATAAAALLGGGAAADAGSPAGPPVTTAAAVLAAAAPLEPGRPAVSGVPGFDVLDVVATLAAAAAELAEGDAGALERLPILLGAGEPTWSWPDHVHPATGSGSGGRGASPVALAGFLLLGRDLLVVEPAAGHAVLVPVLPAAWWGQSLGVHDVVLSGGERLSFAVRWHGTRPALLWEASRPLRLTAPGLDPSFTADGARGEVLLGEVTSTSMTGGGTVELS